MKDVPSAGKEFNSTIIVATTSLWGIKLLMRYIMESVRPTKAGSYRCFGREDGQRQRWYESLQKGNAKQPTGSFRHPFIHPPSPTNASKKKRKNGLDKPVHLKVEVVFRSKKNFCREEL